MAGAAVLPFVMTVNPNDTEAPAARFPLPLGPMVITLPLLSQDGVPFQVVDTFCGDVTVTGTVQPLIAELPALTVTCPLNRSPQVSVLAYVAVQVAPPVPPSPPPEPPSAASTAVYAGFLR